MILFAGSKRWKIHRKISQKPSKRRHWKVWNINTIEGYFLIALSNEKIKQLKDLEFSYVPFAATKENTEILEAEVYARRLKENELVKSGVDVEKIKEEAANIEIQMNPILSKYYEARRQGEAKIDPEKIKESFERFEVF